MTETRITALVNGTMFDNDIAGEDCLLHKRRFASKTAARRFINSELSKPIPTHLCSMWACIIVEQYDEQYGWLRVEESDTIGIGDLAPVKFFAV